MNACLVYHFWSEPDDLPPERNLRCPVLLSLITFRSVDWRTPVIVLDLGGTDWGSLPYEWGFRVVRTRPRFPSARVLGRIPDVRRFAESSPYETIVYTDCDTFWMEPLRVGPSDRFAFDGYNNGFFYFGRSKECADYLDAYERLAVEAIGSPETRRRLFESRRCPERSEILDEAITGYLALSHPTRRIGADEHLCFSSDGTDVRQQTRFQMIHANRMRVTNPWTSHEGQRRHSRGLIPLLIEELFERFSSVTRLERHYTNEEIRGCQPLRVGLKSLIGVALRAEGGLEIIGEMSSYLDETFCSVKKGSP